MVVVLLLYSCKTKTVVKIEKEVVTEVKEVINTVYTDTGLTALFVGGNLWYLWGIEGTAYQIGNDGVITAFFNCP